jgi:hypothetical protein
MESLIEGSHPEKAITAFRKSAGLGNYEGNLQLARAYENGVFGENNRITKAFDLLAEAVDDNYAPAKIALADFSIRNGIHDEDYCPHQLLEEAIDDGIEGAIEMLALYEAMMMHDHGLELLPSEVVPTDMTRPQQIREVLLGSTGATDEQAELLIAAWHGFRSWEDMSIACSGAHKIQGRFDEDCTLDEIVSRKNAQVDILARKIAAPRYVAEAIWELLRPTSRDFKPSLDTLDELLQEKGQGH